VVNEAPASTGSAAPSLAESTISSATALYLPDVLLMLSFLELVLLKDGKGFIEVGVKSAPVA